MLGTVAWTFAAGLAAVLATAVAVRMLPFGAAADVHTFAARAVGATALLAATLWMLGHQPGAMAALAAGVVLAIRLASHTGADLRIAAWGLVGGALVAMGTAGPGPQSLGGALPVVAGCLASVALVEYLMAGARWGWRSAAQRRAPPRPPRPPRPQGAHGAQARRPPQGEPSDDR